MLLSSRQFSHLSTIFTVLSRKEHTLTEHGFVHMYTPLQFFSSRGLESVVSRLLTDGADPNDVFVGRPKNQLSALKHAIGFHSASIVSLLIDHGARVNSRDGVDNGCSPLEIAVGKPHQVHPQLLPDKQGYITRSAELPQIVQLLLDAGADVNSEHPRRGTPLHIACNDRNTPPQIVATLIAAGADVHARFDGPRATRATDSLAGGIQPIHYAATRGQTAIVQLLLDAGVDIEAQTRNGIRPLDAAILANSAGVSELLITTGADTDTDSALCEPITTSNKELNRLLSAAREFSGVPDTRKLLQKEAKRSLLLRWLDLRGCRPNPGHLGVWSGPRARNTEREWLAFYSM